MRESDRESERVCERVCEKVRESLRESLKEKLRESVKAREIERGRERESLRESFRESLRKSLRDTRMIWKKKTSVKESLCFEACGALKKAQDQDLASTLVKRAFFSIEITSVFGALKFPDF